MDLFLYMFHGLLFRQVYFEAVASKVALLQVDQTSGAFLKFEM